MAQTVQGTEPITPEGAGRLRIRSNCEVELTGRAPEQARSDVLITGLRPNPQLKIAVRNIIPNRRVRNENLRGTTLDSVVSFEEVDKTQEFARAPHRRDGIVGVQLVICVTELLKTSGA